MLSGITLAAKALKPDIIIIAAEPSGSNDAADVAASKAQGRLIQDMPKPVTVADGLEGELVGWPGLRCMCTHVCVLGGAKARLVACMPAGHFTDTMLYLLLPSPCTHVSFESCLHIPCG